MASRRSPDSAEASGATLVAIGQTCPSRCRWCRSCGGSRRGPGARLTSGGSSDSGAALTSRAAAPTSAVPTTTVAALPNPSTGNGSYTTSTITVGNSPVGVAVDQYAHLAYVANHGSNTVSVIDTRTNRVSATVPVGAGPAGVAAGGRTHTVYVTVSGEDLR